MKKPLLVAAFLLVFVVPSLSQSKARESLRGLSGVPVQVVYIKDFEAVDTLLTSFVELRLRQSGIKVHDRRLAIDGNALLRITVLVDSTGTLRSVETELRQDVSLKRRPGAEQFVVTWGAASNSCTGKGSEANIKESINGQLDHFINDFLAANPK